jgi:hypothetical protein
MSPHTEVFQAIPFDASYEANEPLIAAGDAEEEKDHRIEEKAFSSFKFSALLLGLLVGFFIQFSTLGANFLVITLWGEDVITKSKTDIIVFSLLWSFFTSAMAIVILGFLRNLVTITYSAVGGRSVDLLEEMVLHMECRFVVGALVGVCLAWTMTDVLLGMRAQIVYSLVTLVVALVWCKTMMMCFATDYSKTTTSARRQQTVTVV